MAYDAARGVTELFGGGQYGSFSGETWEWDGLARPEHKEGSAFPSRSTP
jgi:hypothetical protein